MAGRRTGAGLALAAVALSAAGCSIGGSTKTVTSTVTRTITTTRTVTQSSAAASDCTGSQLSGSFAVESGSEGAGQIAYVLTLSNTAQTSCRIGGAPVATLLDANGSPLPTSAGSAGVVGVVTLQPGASAKATARFSPDVPGKGDAKSGPCQPKAYTLRVTPDGGGTVDAPIKPPTSVCERGTLGFSSYFGPA